MFTVSNATLNCKQNTWMQYLLISFIGDTCIFLNFSRACVGLEFYNLLFTFLSDTFYTWNAHLGTRKVELIKPSFQAKASAQKLFFYLNNRPNAPQNIKEIRTLNTHFH